MGGIELVRHATPRRKWKFGGEEKERTVATVPSERGGEECSETRAARAALCTIT